MKIGILTIIDNNNYGNRLQNYAIQEKIKSLGAESETIINFYQTNNIEKNIFKNILKKIITKYENLKVMDKYRIKYFKDFNKNILFSKEPLDFNKNKSFIYDFCLVGSDQVWNPLMCRLKDADLLKFIDKEKRISFSASFGIEEIPNSHKYKKDFENFKAISVREDVGKKIVEDLTNRKDVEILVDPTMLLDANEWDKVSKEPENMIKRRYILNYFLGGISEERKKEINRIAEENNCSVINILDKKDPFYISGPSEFLYLEKNAFLICTDSFHSSVFAILYNTPFIVFNREDKTECMNSRIDTLLSKFELKDRYYNGKITNNLLKCDYSKSYKILELERKKSDDFLKKALDIKE